jgi:hypothetical protein
MAASCRNGYILHVRRKYQNARMTRIQMVQHQHFFRKLNLSVYCIGIPASAEARLPVQLLSRINQAFPSYVRNIFLKNIEFVLYYYCSLKFLAYNFLGEMDLAKSRAIRLVFGNGWGAEDFRKNPPVPCPERTL